MEKFIMKHGNKEKNMPMYLHLFEDILMGLYSLHSNKQVHRDLKPANIFLKGNPSDFKAMTAKLGDFGLAKELNKDNSSKITIGIGTIAYMSPERLLSLPYEMPSDMWAIGIIIYETLAAKPPFITVASMVNDKPTPLPSYVPPELQALVIRLLEKEAVKRPTCEMTLKEIQGLAARQVPIAKKPFGLPMIDLSRSIRVEPVAIFERHEDIELTLIHINGEIHEKWKLLGNYDFGEAPFSFVDTEFKKIEF